MIIGNKKKKKKNVLKFILASNPKATEAKLIDQGSQYYLSRGDHEEARNFVKAATDSSALKEARKETLSDIIDMDMHSIHAVSLVKKESDKVDPYHIYSINDRHLNITSSFVFKSSTVACRLALQMHNMGGLKNPMQEQVVYMDGMHGCVNGYVTLTMWVYSPVTLGVLKLATMDAKSENIEIFLSNFLKMLRQESKDPKFMWNPHGFMVDENGTNKLAIMAVFGKAMSKKTVSCQWDVSDVQRNNLHMFLRAKEQNLT